MSNHILWLHLGTPKTGSTAVQRCFHSHRDELMECGWSYPNLADDGTDHIPNGVPLCQVYERFLGIGDGDAEAEWNRIHDSLFEQLKNRNVIISAEAFWILDDIENFLLRIKQRISKLKIIVYLRRQDTYLEAGWNQMVKIYNCNDWYVHSLEEFYKGSDCNHYNYLLHLERIASVVGEDNLVVRTYEPGSFLGTTKDIVSDFLSVLQIPLEKLGIHRKERINLSMNWQLLEIKRIFNGMYNGSDLRWWIKLWREYQLAHPLDKSKGAVFTPEERKFFMNQFKEENEEIARRFQHKPDGVLFQDMNMDIPCNYEEATPLMRETISFFFTLAHKQKMIMDMRTRVLVDTQIGKKKKLAYFGAGNIGSQCLRENGYRVDLFIDNNKNAGSVENVPIVASKQIDMWQDYLIIITCEAYSEIEKQLDECGLRRDVDYMNWIDFFA